MGNKPGRPKNQTARREALVDAAGRAIAERGLEGLRIKDIAAEAGMSAGSVLYYYPEMDELVLEVHRGAVERYLAARQGAVDGATGAAARLRALVGSGLPGGSGDAVHGLLFELHRRADRSSGHATLMASLFAREVALYATVLEVGSAVGEFTLTEPVTDLARNLVALEDGYGLHIVSRNAELTPDVARRLLLGYARTVTGCPEL
ncbi:MULTISPECIES: TetR/AcrR family transcriptional regulator [unclassified Streptomyces]|uniref:TetR/AcrR family transcriptional regulator n=1 Tax=unclassified Streptomyces TaxID=2593676 RepID=UPI00225ABB17|nr:MULTISPECIES: TetR family transcriptional regulator [unclassified Streptomyces]MCX5438134.1 TetR family transcriptional regulator [Streptomyces sp. NBC_00063]WSE15784.1 TetR family transcriptional regulator [Streptomyces sp. NBC_01397]WUB95308.1 TetR family transcriptional regulator [Streptomyces sp. NBC_00569]